MVLREPGDRELLAARCWRLGGFSSLAARVCRRLASEPATYGSSVADSAYSSDENAQMQKLRGGCDAKTFDIFVISRHGSAAMDLAVACLRFCQSVAGDTSFRAGIPNQAICHVDSEQHRRGTFATGERVFLRHVRIALGSLAELDTQLEIADPIEACRRERCAKSPNRSGAHREAASRTTPNAQSKHRSGTRDRPRKRKRLRSTRNLNMRQVCNC